MSGDIEYRPKFSQPMVADLTRFLEKNNLFEPEKEWAFRGWLEQEILSAKMAKFDDYTLSTMHGMMMRCVFLGMFLEKSIGAKQMCVLKPDKKP